MEADSPARSPRRWRWLLALVIAWSGGIGEAPAQDTTRVGACRGTTVRLSAPRGFETYRWTVGEDIGNPLAREISFPARRDGVYVVEYERAAGANLVVNGDFEAGNSGFSSDYRYAPAGTTDQGTYAVMTNPRDFNRGFTDCTDPSGGRSRMYVADGATRRGAKAWCQRVRVSPGRRYAFQLSVASLVTASPPRLAFAIDGERLGSANLPRSTCAWQRFFTIWRAPAGADEVEICIFNDNETPEGNDFVLDDISLRPLVGDGPATTTYLVSIAEAQFFRLDTAVCAGQRYTANGLDLAPGEAGVAELKTVAGCDSTLTVVTTLAESIVTAERNDTNCLGTTVRYGGLALSRDTVITRRAVAASGCDSTHVYTLRFFSRTALELTLTPPRCAGDGDGRIDVAVTAGKPPFRYRWSDGRTGASLADVRAGTYGLEVVDRDGCRAEATVTVPDPPPVLIDALTPSPAACFGEASGSVTYEGSGGTGDLSAVVIGRGDGAAPSFDPRRLPPGAYVLRVTDTAGCFAERPFTVTSPPEVVLELTGDSTVRLGETARYSLRVGGDGVTTRWDVDLAPVDSLVSDGQLAFVPTAGGLVRVVGTDVNGCDREATIALRVRRVRQSFFPQAFSPDGDGVNDDFGAVAAGALRRVLRLEVYHRWGGLAFVGTDARARWDGRDVATRVALDPGVFFYRAEVELIDGTVEEQLGEVVLLR